MSNVVFRMGVASPKKPFNAGSFYYSSDRNALGIGVQESNGNVLLHTLVNPCQGIPINVTEGMATVDLTDEIRKYGHGYYQIDVVWNLNFSTTSANFQQRLQTAYLYVPSVTSWYYATIWSDTITAQNLYYSNEHDPIQKTVSLVLTLNHGPTTDNPFIMLVAPIAFHVCNVGSENNHNLISYSDKIILTKLQTNDVLGTEAYGDCWGENPS